jgi:hypothetical protein
MSAERFSFTVWRDKWLRGDMADGSCLLDTNGCRCCLGFLGQAVGYTDEQLLGASTPEDIACDKWPRGLILCDDHERREDDSEVCEKIVNANDEGPALTREERLTELFASIGIDVTFRDGTGEESGAA